MVPSELLPIIYVFSLLYVAVIVFSYWGLRRAKRGLLEQAHEAKRHMYEIAILKEIGDRTGYSLNIQKILDVIVGSLNQFIDYSAVSYMLLSPSKIVFKADLDKSVSPQFIKDIRTRMLSALSALLGREFAESEIEEIITGAMMLDAVDSPVQSYFNIPLVIGGQVVGILTVANTKAGLYKEEEMEILYKIVNQASQAVTRLEEVVKTEQGKIAATIESMIEGVIMTDLDYRVIAANPAVKKIIGYNLASIPTIFEFMDAFKGSIDIKSKLEESMKLDKILPAQEIFFNNNYYQVVVSPVRSNPLALKEGDKKGAILGGVVIFHDISTEKESEKMRNDFISMMVHELRSPLGNIKKIGEMMQTTKVLDDKKASGEYVSMLYESSSSMLDLVNDLLDVAKLEAGKFDIDKQTGNVKKIINDRVKFFSTTATDKGVTLKSFGDETASCDVPIDEKRITQVLNNMVSNAVNYTLRGGEATAYCFMHKNGKAINEEALTLGAPWIVDNMPLHTDSLPDSVVVAVTDSGEGMTKEDMSKLFNKFTQFTSSARDSEHKGTGLGLVIVKGIVEAHGGTVGAGSRKGEGSTFYFTLPL